MVYLDLKNVEPESPCSMLELTFDHLLHHEMIDEVSSQLIAIVGGNLVEIIPVVNSNTVKDNKETTVKIISLLAHTRP